MATISLNHTYNEAYKVRFHFTNKGKYILVEADSTIAEYSGEWGQIYMNWKEFLALPESEKVYLAEQSVW